MKALFILLLVSPVVFAGPMYKCVDTKGVASYQQMPCPKASKEARHDFVQAAPDAPGLNWSSQVRRSSQSRSVSLGSGTASGGYASSAPAMSQYERDERQRRAEIAATDPGLTSSQRRAAVAAELGQPAPAPYSAPAPPYYAAPVTQVRTDQYGNTYTQPAGSDVTINNQTGRPCVMNGNVIIKCN